MKDRWLTVRTLKGGIRAYQVLPSFKERYNIIQGEGRCLFLLPHHCEGASFGMNFRWEEPECQGILADLRGVLLVEVEDIYMPGEWEW